MKRPRIEHLFRVAEKPLHVIMPTIVLLYLVGCGSFLSRPAPSREDFIAHYLEYFDGSQIDKLDYVWEGAVGGIFSVGRAQFKGPVKLREIMVQARINDGLVTIGTYEPVEMQREPGIVEFKRDWEVHAGGRLPSWFDFPFSRKMRTITEASEGSDGHPPYHLTWFIDDERNVVYIRVNRG